MTKTKFMKNLIPSAHPKIQDKTTELVEKYMYLGHEIKISSENQTKTSTLTKRLLQI